MTTFAKFSGLHTAHNPVKSVPEGALATAENCLINSQDVVEPRRGQYPLTYTAGAQIKVGWPYGTSRLVHHGTSIARDTGSAFSDYTGTFTAVDDTLCRMRGVEAAQNFYVNTATGVKVLDSGGTFSSAGVPQCLDVTETSMTTSASGFLATDRAVAYRGVVTQTDANGKKRYGAPSQRTIVRNMSGYDIPVAGMVRTGGTTVTVSLSGSFLSEYITVGNTLTLTTNEADFVTGIKTVVTVNRVANSFTYTEAGANVASGIVHTFTVPTRSVIVNVGVPTTASSGDLIELYRTAVAEADDIDPGDETYQVGEKTVPAAVSVTAGNATCVGTTVTVTSNSHPYVVGQLVESTPADSKIAVGVHKITSITANTFVYTDLLANAGSNSVTLTYTPRTVVIEDNTPDSMLGDPLYTNPNTGDGLEASHYEPPIAKDMCFFGERMWWLNYTDRQRIELQLLGTSGIGTRTVTVTVSSTAYTYSGYTTTDYQTNAFGVWTSGNPDVNVEQTARALVHVINNSVVATPFYAVYASADDDQPGRIVLIAKSMGTGTMTVTCSSTTIGAMFSPVLPTSGTTIASSNDADAAGVMWSDSDPESAPLGNRLRVTAKNDPIYRGIGLRDSLFIFKKQGGVFTIPNQLPFKPRELDPTCRLLAPDTVVPLNNQLFALTQQGLCTVTEAGVDIIGWPLDYDVRALLNTAQAAITRIPFAVAYESERQLWLWLPTNGSSTTATQAYVYNHATRAFTHVTKNRTCGFVMPGTDILWMGSGDAHTLVRERKDFAASDYADETYAVTLSAMSGTALTLSDTSNLAVGDVLDDGSGHDALVTAVNGSVATISLAAAFTVPSTVTIYKGYEVSVVQTPQALGEPGVSKTIARAVISFQESQVHLGKATISTDEAPTTVEYAFDTTGYGALGYGGGFYGDPATLVNKYAALGTSGAFVQMGFKIRQARAKWRLLAFTADIAGQTTRGR